MTLDTLQPVGTLCRCVRTHNPPPVLLEHHHVWPKEYGGPTVPDNMVWICATTHNTVHVFIKIFMEQNRTLSFPELRERLDLTDYPVFVNRYAYRLAVRGWVAIQTQTVQP